MFTKIIADILAFLLLLFPNWGNLRFMYLTRIFDADAITTSIMRAIDTGDIGVLESVMCKNITGNATDLTADIHALIAAIDGRVIEYSRRSPDEYVEAKNGKRIIQKTWDISVKTATETYWLVIVWEVANNFSLEETGIRAIVLKKDLYPTYPILAEMRATEGVGQWHE
jgi:hypothetical protein